MLLVTVCCLHGSWLPSDCWPPPSYPDNSARVSNSSSVPFAHSIDHILPSRTSSSTEHVDTPEGAGESEAKLQWAQAFPTPAPTTATTLQGLSFSLAPSARLRPSARFSLRSSLNSPSSPVLQTRYAYARTQTWAKFRFFSQKTSGLEANHRMWLKTCFSVLKYPMADREWR